MPGTIIYCHVTIATILYGQFFLSSMHESLLDHEIVGDPVEPLLPSLREINPVLEYILYKQVVHLDVSLACLHHIKSSGRFEIHNDTVVIDSANDGDQHTVDIGGDQ